jgi:hypothetical protein
MRPPRRREPDAATTKVERPSTCRIVRRSGARFCQQHSVFVPAPVDELCRPRPGLVPTVGGERDVSP